MAELTIKLTGDLEASVDVQIESGAFATVEGVVRAGLPRSKVSRWTQAALKS
jgi:Arc/MetJ-type ribon-helix-helix transcriptional regulator